MSPKQVRRRQERRTRSKEQDNDAAVARRAKRLARKRSGKMHISVEKKDAWNIPQIWSGGTAFILGGGPGLNNINFDLIKHRRIIGVNNAYGDPLPGEREKKAKYAPRHWVDVCWFGDERWYWWHKKSLDNFRGILATCRVRLHNKNRILGCHRGKGEGIDTRPRYISWNKSSGASAINLAYHFGVKTIVLLGFDMRRVSNRPNWHVDHPSPNKDPYPRFLRPFKAIAKDAKHLKVEIINATPESTIKEFPIMTLEEYLEKENNQ